MKKILVLLGPHTTLATAIMHMVGATDSTMFFGDANIPDKMPQVDLIIVNGIESFSQITKWEKVLMNGMISMAGRKFFPSILICIGHPIGVLLDERYVVYDCRTQQIISPSSAVANG